jgi:hypothetical protein
MNNSTPVWCGPGWKEERPIIDLDSTDETEEIEEDWFEDQDPELSYSRTFHYLVPSPFGTWEVSSTYKLHEKRRRL